MDFKLKIYPTSNNKLSFLCINHTSNLKSIISVNKQSAVLNIFTNLEFVAHADEAELAGFLPDVFGAVGVLEELTYKQILGLANETSQRHVQSVVVLLHEPSLKEEEIDDVLLESRCRKKKLWSDHGF